jgi:hypothetical protein
MKRKHHPTPFKSIFMPRAKKIIAGKRVLPSDNRYYVKPKPISTKEEGYHMNNSHHIKNGRETNRKSSERAY